MTREKAINLVMKVFDTLEGECNIEYDWREEHEARDMAIEALEQEPRKGHWIRGKERHFLDTRTDLNVEMKEATGKGYHTYINAQCSKCRMITIHDDSIFYKYCPHCGAKMQERRMTREEAIRILYSIDNADEMDEEYAEAYNMAIKALEQDSILDKIRAEIMDFEEELFHRPNTDYTDYAAVRHCVEIIDKYKAGMESKV